MRCFFQFGKSKKIDYSKMVCEQNSGSAFELQTCAMDIGHHKSLLFLLCLQVDL